MARKTTHQWAFRARFRRRAFGWRSQPAVTRIREAVSEIKKAARGDPVLGGEGAVLFLEKISAAIEQVDSSSGAIGGAVNNAITTLASIITAAEADDATRNQWLERLWRAVEEDDMPYLEQLPDYWGELCVSPDRASNWADSLIGEVRMVWAPNRQPGGYFKGTAACLSALLKAGRHDELLRLLECAPHSFWHDRQWGVKALTAMGKAAEAIEYAEDCRGSNDHPVAIARACEAILLANGMPEAAYQRYAIEANQKTTYLATFRAIGKKYPNKSAREVLADLVASTPDDQGKWFAAAKSAELYSDAIDLANRSPCDPKTLTRAARDMMEKQPRFALEAGIAALRWLIRGYGYDITAIDVRTAYDHTMQAAKHAGCLSETRERVRNLVAGDVSGDQLVSRILGQELGLPERN